MVVLFEQCGLISRILLPIIDYFLLSFWVWKIIILQFFEQVFFVTQPFTFSSGLYLCSCFIGSP